MKQFDEAKKILEHQGLHKAQIDRIAQQICQLFEPESYNATILEHKKRPDLVLVDEDEPDKEGLLSPLERRAIIESFPASDKTVDINLAMLKAQRDLTASIKDVWYNELLEEFVRVKVDRSHLMDRLNEKGAECQARVERIYHEIEKSGLIPHEHDKGKAFLVGGTKEYCLPNCRLCRWQALKKEGEDA